MRPVKPQPDDDAVWDELLASSLHEEEEKEEEVWVPIWVWYCEACGRTASGETLCCGDWMMRHAV